MNLVLLAMAAVIGFGTGACCPKQLQEAENAISSDPDLSSAGPIRKTIQAKTLFISDEVSRSEKSETFLIVDAKPRSTGSDPVPRRKLNRKKYVSIRVKGGDAQ